MVVRGNVLKIYTNLIWTGYLDQIFTLQNHVLIAYSKPEREPMIRLDPTSGLCYQKWFEGLSLLFSKCLQHSVWRLSSWSFRMDGWGFQQWIWPLKPLNQWWKIWSADRDAPFLISWSCPYSRKGPVFSSLGLGLFFRRQGSFPLYEISSAPRHSGLFW